MPGSLEPARREPFLPWTEAVGKYLDDSLVYGRKKATFVISYLHFCKTQSEVQRSDGKKSASCRGGCVMV